MNLGVTVSGVILIAELSGYSGLATYLLESALIHSFYCDCRLDTHAVCTRRPGVGLFPYRPGNDPPLAQACPRYRLPGGTIDEFVHRSPCLHVPILAAWGVYDSHGEAMKGVLSLGVTIGSLRLTVGFVLLATLLLYGTLLASRAVQNVLTEDVFPRRNLERGAQISMARLVHYGFVLVGFLLALAALGFDLKECHHHRRRFGSGNRLWAPAGCQQLRLRYHPPFRKTHQRW